jgi:flavin reductase
MTTGLPQSEAEGHARAFREGMARLAAAVNVLTAATPDGPTGMTASAVMSVSDSPPTLVAAVNTRTRFHAALVAADAFAVNTLAAHQSGIADQFAGRGSQHMEERFQHGRWASSISGLPILSDCTAVFECQIARSIVAGSHTLFIGAVVAVHHSSDQPPLLYARRGYGTFLAPLGA